MLRGVVCGLTVLAVSCGGDDGGGGGGGGGQKWACDTSADNDACIEYTGSEWIGVRRPNYENTCTTHTPSAGAVLSACPTGGPGGKCLQFAGAPTEQTMFFYKADTADEQQNCATMGGTWSSL